MRCTRSIAISSLVTAVLALIGVIPALLLWRRGKGAADDAPVYESYVAPLG